ncbi:LPS assembly protein LptD [Orbaceae bacterium ESL0727]|nr:LPS assembly protein LptD [Orbaceae bacterium ESL0727]
MKKFAPSLIAIAVTLTLYSHVGYASDTSNASNNNYVNQKLPNYYTNQQCLVDVPTFDRPLVKGDINTLPVNAESNQFQAMYPNLAIYQGDVVISQGNRSIQANRVVIDTKDNRDREVTLDGDFVYQDNLIKMKGNNASMNLNNNDLHVNKSEYQLVDRLGRGTADDMQVEKNRYIILKNGNFTSCPVSNNSWNIEGSTIIHDNQEQLLEVWNAVFRIGKVPVLYSPYLQLPTGNKRRSGLLIPELSYDNNNGIDFAQPVYWNIAPNYDATFTPRVLQRRGVQMQTEFRYLNEIGLGTTAFDWLQHDSLYSKDNDKNADDESYSSNKSRWLFHWKNDELINYNWRFYVDSTRVSDNRYLTDLDSKYASETDGYLTQYYKVGYTDESWDIGLNYRHFQSFRQEIRDDLFRTEPQLDLNYYNYDFGPFKFKTFAQVSRFVTANHNNPKTWRTHVEPTLDYTLTNSWASLTNEVGMMATRYNQELPSNYRNLNNNNSILDRNVSRFVPKFSSDGKIIFERDTVFLQGYTQTLEPRVRYLYIPYRNQSHIGNYDSTLLQSDYIGLFRDQPYSGLDRIASANKVSTGVTTRFYDSSKIERFNFSLGQINYFTQSKTGDRNSTLDKNRDTGSITWAADNFWQIADDFIFRSGVQYDTRLNTVSLASTTFEYRPISEKLVQLSYRYANHNYIDSIGASYNTPYKQDISQAGIMTSWPLTATVSAVGSYYYDTKLRQMADGFAGLRYSNCCWAMSVQYGRKLTDWDLLSRESKYENKLSVNFELQGLGRYNNAMAKMLNFGKLPYITTFEEKATLEQNNGTN